MPETPTPLDMGRTLERIDRVLASNKLWEVLFGALATILFLAGIIAVGVTVASGQLIWIAPSVLVSVFLIWPINRIVTMRRENIALSIAPELIQHLPPDEAIREFQRLLDWLYSGSKSQPPRLDP